MEKVAFGMTGQRVSRLGIGLYEIRSLSGAAGAAEAGRMLNAALDSGINFLDTAGCYGNSEDLIGTTVGHRRDEYVLATKAGHSNTPGVQPWTARAVAESIDRSLRRLKTDRLDLVQLHSCGVDVLKKGDVVDALVRARDAGKTRFIGYSGDEDAAIWAVQCGMFDSLQTTYNIIDQHARTRRILERAEEKGMGIIIKRPVANFAWGGRAWCREFRQPAPGLRSAGQCYAGIGSDRWRAERPHPSGAGIHSRTSRSRHRHSGYSQT